MSIQFPVYRNVPPRRCKVNPGVVIEYGGRVYTGAGYYDAMLGVTVDKEGDTFLCGDGGVVEEWDRAGLVTVEEQSTANQEAAIEAWNGAEGDDIRAAAHAHIDSHITLHNAKAVAAGLDHLVTERTHDHGFAPYEHGDPDNPVEMEVTRHRVRLAKEQNSE